jgi:L-alanine-DL-glutamate epimerase-like enolase superfamily enzyme
MSVDLSYRSRDATDYDAPPRFVYSGERSTSAVLVERLQFFEFNRFFALLLLSPDGTPGFVVSRPVKPARSAAVRSLIARVASVPDARDPGMAGTLIETSAAGASRDVVQLASTCLELAMFDLVGRIDGIPVSRLLGQRRRERIPLYLSSKDRVSEPERELENIGEILGSTGIVAVKLKVGTGSGRADDVEIPARRAERLIPTARSRLGDDVTIYIDGNGSFTPARAIEIAHIARDSGIAWFEEPCPYDDLASMTRVSQAAVLPVAAGERASSVDWFRKAVDSGACQVVQPDLWKVGGYGPACRIAEYAGSRGVSAVLHHPQGPIGYLYALHFAAGVENSGSFQEYRAGLESTSGWFEEPMEIVNGQLQLPTRPGFGIALDPDAIVHELNKMGRRSLLSWCKERIFGTARRTPPIRENHA